MLWVLDLFSGIGGFSLGLERTGGFKTVAFCEIDKFCQQVLAKHWSTVPIFEDIHDITTFTLHQRNIGRIDVITAGFPCQPFSVAGKQLGTEDERFLWTQLYRVIEQVRPKYIILENVPRLLSIQNGLIFAGILYDFRKIGYDVEWQVISAAAFGAWHKRERVWIVAYPCSQRRRQRRYYWKGRHLQIDLKRNCQKVQSFGKGRVNWARALRSVFPNSHTLRLQGGQLGKCEKETQSCFSVEIFNRYARNRWDDLPTPNFCRSSDGIPDRSHRLKSLGNAVVPQISQFIGGCILDMDI